MAYFLVDQEQGMSIELPVPEQFSRAMSMQWERLADDEARCMFARKVSRHLMTFLPELIDWDIREPTPKQVSYAMVLSRELDAPIPPDALRFRGLMHEFIEKHARLAKKKWAAQRDGDEQEKQSPK